MKVNLDLECAITILDDFEKYKSLNNEAREEFKFVQSKLFEYYNSIPSFWFKKKFEDFNKYYFGVCRPTLGDFWFGRNLRKLINLIDSSDELEKMLSLMYYSRNVYDFSKIETLMKQIERYSKFQKNQMILSEDDVILIERYHMDKTVLETIKFKKDKIREIFPE